MGYVIQPQCTCGYQHKQIFMGGGIKNYETSCEVPFYCEECSKIKTRNLFKKRPKCKKCKDELKIFGVLDDDIECEECIKLIPKEVLNESFKCGSCRKVLKMYGEIIGYFNDKNLDFDYMKDLEKNSFNWSFLLDMTYFLRYESNYCPKCKTNNLSFNYGGVWD
jgi:hypothetical protein